MVIKRDSEFDHDPGTRLDLNLLQVFDMVMVERHVTRASERLGLTQPAVSNALNRLRAQFDDALFIKAARGVEPTQRALSLWPDIHEAITQLNRAVRPGQFNPAIATTEFRMSMVDLSAALLTPFLYKRIQTLAPGVTLAFVPHVPELTAERLSRGEVDFAVSIESPRFSSLQSHALWSESYVVAGRRDHPLLNEPLTIETLCAAPALGVNLSGSPSFQAGIDIALSAQGFVRPIRLTVNQFLVATTMLRESDLLAVLPFRLVADAFRQHWLAYQPLPLELPRAVLHLSWHRRNNGIAAMEWLKNTVLEAGDELNRQSMDADV